MIKYKANYFVANVYNPELDIVIVGNINTYVDMNVQTGVDEEGNPTYELQEVYLMQIPFPQGIRFVDIPVKTTEGIAEYVKVKIEKQLQSFKQRIEEVKTLKELGLFDEQERVISEIKLEGEVE